MPEYKLGEIETRFATLIWDNEPLSSGTLVKLAQETLNWKKSTTYTILRRLCEKGIFQNQNGMVTSLISKEEFYERQSNQFVEETFHGSLPAFINAFTRQKHLSDEEIQEIIAIIHKNGDT